MLLDKWIAESMREDHERGITHGAGISSTGAIWCPFCYRAWVTREATKRAVTKGKSVTNPDESELTDA
jgi:hypothetical protein